MVNLRWSCLLLAVSLLLGGCRNDNVVEIAGSVTLDGEPLEQGVIAFRPVDGDGPTAEAMIVAGKYRAALRPGAKRVEVQGFRQRGEEHALPDDPTSPLVPRLEPIVPPRYQADSTLTLHVEHTTQHADFALTTMNGK